MVRFLRQLIDEWCCPHYRLSFLDNFYGDAIHFMGCRSLYTCEHCGKTFKGKLLHTDHLPQVGITLVQLRSWNGRTYPHNGEPLGDRITQDMVRQWKERLAESTDNIQRTIP